jgi:DamX protein
MSEVTADSVAPPVNPFVGPAPSFFELGDRRMHLEKLRHLSQWVRRVLLVTGPCGVGKSALYRQLSASLEPRAKAARINGSLVSGSREVLTAMVHGFGLAAPSDADTQLLQEIVSEHAHDQEQAGRICVTLVDDADMLEPRALEQLLALASRSPLRVVMFGEVRLVRAVERIAGLLDVDWHEIRLMGFNPEEVRAYLQWRFSRVGYRSPLPFTDAQVKELARLSDGLPGRIDQMATVLMGKLRSGAAERPGRGFPRQHAALLAVLVVAVSLVYLLQPARDPAAPSVGAPVAVTRIEVPATRSGAEPAPAATVPEVTASPEIVKAAPPEPVAPPGRVESAPGPAAPPAPPARDPEPTPKPAPSAAATPAPRPPNPAPAGSRDARWVMAQPATAFTIQLVTLSAPERAAQYVAAQPDPAQFATYRLQRDGRILHVVVYGSFGTRDQAEAAARLLPATVGEVQPWIRPFAQVQDAARTALQQ